MGLPWKLGKGYADARVVTAVDGDGDDITDVFTGSESLVAEVWAGDDQTPLLTLTPTWLVAADGTITVAIAASDSAALEPGSYTLDVYQAGKVAHFYRGTLVILPSAGTAPPPFSYVGFDKLATFAAQVGTLLDSVQDQTGFAEQRAQASRDFDRMVLNRYRPIPGRSRRYVSADGLSAGPYAVFSPSADGSPAPTRAALAGLLGTAAVIVSADIEEVVAHLALEIVYLGQPGSANPYREAGAMHKGMALAAFRTCVVEIDTDDDDAADLRVDQDVTFLE